MSEYLQFLLLGLGNGAVYAALALGLVVTYRSSGIVNLGTGAIALYGSYTYAYLVESGDLIVLVPGLPTTVDLGGPMPMALAMGLALVITALLSLALYELVFRPLRHAPPLAASVASLGVLVVVQALVVLRLGTTPLTVPNVLPEGRWTLPGDVPVSQERLWFAVVIIAVALALSAMSRFTRFGMATEAVAETEKGAVVTGLRPQRIAALNWMIAGGVAGLAGILIAPITSLTPLAYSLFIVPALAAATVGRFRGLLPAAIAGLAIGMLQSETELLTVKFDWFPSSGAAELIPLVIILSVLLLSSSALPERGTLVRETLGHAPRPRSIGLATVGGVAIGVAGLVLTQGTWRAAVIGSMIFALIALSLVVVTGYAGQVSFAQLALAGVAAFSLSTIAQGWDVPFPIAPILAALFATVVGVVVGLPALRLRGLTLGIVTLSFAVAIEALWFRNPDFVTSSGKSIPDPELFGWDLDIGSGSAFPRLQFGFMVLAVLTVVAIGVAMLRRSRLGSALLAIRANERSAAAAGVDVVRLKLLAFAIASFIAGLGGTLLAYRRGTVSFDSFTALAGLALFASVYLAGITSVSGGLLAGALISGGLVSIAMDRWLDLGEWYAAIVGAMLVVTVIANPEGVVGPFHRLADRVRRRQVDGPPPVELTAPVTSVAARPMHDDRAASATPALSIGSVSVHYGGVCAVDDVSFDVPRGSIVGLIGPNGAGKTSLIDAVTGFARATGEVLLAGRDMTHLVPYQRVRAGLSRTFQAIELYDDLTVEENVSVGLHHRTGVHDDPALVPTLELLGISGLRHRVAGELSQGQRQLVSIARALVSQPTVLVLDEPAAGLDSTESAWLAERLRAARDGGISLLLVDHDMGLVFDVCDRVQVLNLGVRIASGTTDDVRRNAAVAEAYLGTMHAAGAPT